MEERRGEVGGHYELNQRNRQGACVELYETPVGFKYIGELIMQDKIAIGGEESAGMSIRHHVPEEDGVVAGRFWCEMVGRRGEAPGGRMEGLGEKGWFLYSRWRDFPL